MNFLGKLIKPFVLTKKRKNTLYGLADLINEVKKSVTVDQINESIHKVVSFKDTVDRKDTLVREILGKLVEYLIDTKYHVNNGYHKPSHNGWKTVTVYPDINDYVKIGGKIKRF